MSDLAKKIARDIFEAGDVGNSPTERIQFMSEFMSGKWYDDTEKGQGGFCEDALVKCIEATLNQHLASEEQNDLRSLADAVMKAESILRNDLYKTRVKNALVELNEVRDIAMNHMSEK